MRLCGARVCIYICIYKLLDLNFLSSTLVPVTKPFLRIPRLLVFRTSMRIVPIYH